MHGVRWEAQRHTALAAPHGALPSNPGPVRHHAPAFIPFALLDGKDLPWPAEREGLIQSGVAVRASLCHRTPCFVQAPAFIPFALLDGKGLPWPAEREGLIQSGVAVRASLCHRTPCLPGEYEIAIPLREFQIFKEYGTRDPVQFHYNPKG